MRSRDADDVPGAGDAEDRADGDGGDAVADSAGGGEDPDGGAGGAVADSAGGPDIRPMRPEDIDAVLDIERGSYRSPWPPQLFTDELTRDWAYVDLLRVRDSDGGFRVVAFCNYWLVRDEVHLLNLATHPQARRRGHGDVLMAHLLAFARDHDCRYVTLEVRRSNDAARALYVRHGFAAVGVRPRYYAEDGEDAIVMTLDLAPGADSDD